MWQHHPTGMQFDDLTLGIQWENQNFNPSCLQHYGSVISNRPDAQPMWTAAAAGELPLPPATAAPVAAQMPVPPLQMAAAPPPNQPPLPPLPDQHDAYTAWMPPSCEHPTGASIAAGLFPQNGSSRLSSGSSRLSTGSSDYAPGAPLGMPLLPTSAQNGSSRLSSDYYPPAPASTQASARSTPITVPTLPPPAGWNPPPPKPRNPPQRYSKEEADMLIELGDAKMKAHQTTTLVNGVPVVNKAETWQQIADKLSAAHGTNRDSSVGGKYRELKEKMSKNLLDGVTLGGATATSTAPAAQPGSMAALAAKPGPTTVVDYSPAPITTNAPAPITGNHPNPSQIANYLPPGGAPPQQPSTDAINNHYLPPPVQQNTAAEALLSLAPLQAVPTGPGRNGATGYVEPVDDNAVAAWAGVAGTVVTGATAASKAAANIAAKVKSGGPKGGGYGVTVEAVAAELPVPYKDAAKDVQMAFTDPTRMPSDTSSTILPPTYAMMAPPATPTQSANRYAFAGALAAGGPVPASESIKALAKPPIISVKLINNPPVAGQKRPSRAAATSATEKMDAIKQGAGSTLPPPEEGDKKGGGAPNLLAAPIPWNAAAARRLHRRVAKEEEAEDGRRRAPTAPPATPLLTSTNTAPISTAMSTAASSLPSTIGSPSHFML